MNTATGTCPVCDTPLTGMSIAQATRHVDDCLSEHYIVTTALKEDIGQRNNSPNTTQSSTHSRHTSGHDSPFLITCPYPNCGRSMEAKDFPAHAVTTHYAEAQQFACPICALYSDFCYVVTPATNLFQHLQREHYDLLRGVQIPQFPPPITLPPPPPTLFPPFVNINAYESTSSESYEESPSSSPRSGICRLGTQLVKIDEYVEYTVSKGGQECIICTENLETGDRAARLQCLCVYHKSCIDRWFQTKKCCPLHPVSTDYDDD